jgi:hypothetical protein
MRQPVDLMGARPVMAKAEAPDAARELLAFARTG